MTYKVLWVDDEQSIVDGYKQNADSYGIELDHYETWSTAEKSLKQNFDDYSALILDAKCKINANDSAKDEFITTILPSLTQLFSDKKRVLPWYILSAGTMTNFDFVIKSTLAHHKEYETEWGQMLYYKDEYCVDGKDSSELLFDNIIKASKNQTNNKVIYNFQEVFKYLGENKLIDKSVRSTMLTMLAGLYYPEPTFKYDGNPLRKVMEHIFRSAFKVGLLPNECLEDNQVNLIESNRYMSGFVTKHSGLRYGNEGDTIFPKYLGDITLAIINFGNTQSHTSDENAYTINDKDLEISDNEKELFFSYVLQLCHVIKFFGSFVEEHQDEKANKAMITKINGLKSFDLSDYKKKYEGKVALVEQDKKNNFHCGECALSYTKAQRFIGQKIRLTEIKENRKSISEYPVFAEFEQIFK